MKNKMVPIALASLLVGGGGGFWAGQSISSSSSETLVTVNGEKITKNDMFETMEKQMGPQVIEGLVSNALIEQATKKANIKATDAELEKELETVKSQYGGNEQFEQALTSNGMSVSAFKEELATTVKLKKLLSKSITISDKDIQSYFEENQATFDQPEQVQASHILVYDQKEAESLLDKVKKGEDFAKLAKEKSQDVGSAQNGGDLGFFGKGQMEAAFEKAAFSLKKGDISDIVSYKANDPETGEEKTRYHIIKVTDKKPAKKAVLKDNKETIKETLLNQQLQTEYQNWLEKTKKESKIEYKNEAKS